MTTEERIQAERLKLTALFEGLPQNKRTLTEPLIENAAFLRVTLDDLQESIISTGPVDSYRNGEHQSGRKTSAELAAYNSTMKVYASVLATLDKMLPPETAGKLAELLRD